MTAYLFVFLSMLCVDRHADAQNTSWDSNLDRFEVICHKCIRLKNRLAAGERVPEDSISVLTREVGSLKDKLQAVSGDMNPVQERRLCCIKDMYRSGEIFSTVSWVQLPEAKTLSPFSLPGYAVEGLPVTTEYEEPVADAARISPFLSIGVVPDLYVGLGVMYNRVPSPWSVYVKGFTNFVNHQASYTCLSDGTAEDGSTIWVSGARSVSLWGAVAGAHYGITPRWGGYAGVGYASRRLFWEDAFGNWVEVSDKAASGLALDAGVTYMPFRDIRFLAGITYLSSSTTSVCLGVIYSFHVKPSQKSLF
ncbi:MAG: hypothetical protein K6A64_11130 [Bacteroidales bacterium]|nr:hypothetical protein [Bacteroidales bacterium]